MLATTEAESLSIFQNEAFVEFGNSALLKVFRASKSLLNEQMQGLSQSEPVTPERYHRESRSP